MIETATNTTFQKYPAYKDSGEYWMGEIPEHWEIKKLKHVFKEKKKVTNPSLNCGSISFGKVVYKDDEKIPESTKASYQEVLAGEYLVNPLNLNYDLISLRIGLSNINVVVSSGYIVLKNAIEFDKSYFNYLLHRYDVAYMKLLGSGVRQTISFNHIANSLLAYPPKEEQTAIANFLDDKTTKIDLAIAQKEQLMALLKERKQIIIQNAVTKGLDQNVKMKDSDVEWIGEIPEHWKVKRLKYVVKILKRIIGYEGPPVLSITQNGIKIKDITSGEGQLAMDYSKYQIINKGEFAMNHMDLITGYVDISKYDGVISPDYRVFVPFIDEIQDEYLLGLFQVGYKSKIFYRYGQGVSQLGRWRLPADNFNEFSIPIPPKKEQSEIMDYIETQSTKIDQAISLQQTQIQKLKEYKATLIDSAVTGKIKVSEL
ncbi:restriction endonuclease subunit S [Algoriphagus sp. Y33]|uniref:restriction endonuclease subunit S n=1 Tax=Algoriphagus sp. Y33 TaxID=2772483 RepID=UPI0017816B39|nr:restriction endonuclease subunit S [Algoriphagus sp. Y33]